MNKCENKSLICGSETRKTWNFANKFSSVNGDVSIFYEKSVKINDFCTELPKGMSNLALSMLGS